MHSYISIVSDVLSHGLDKKPVRVGENDEVVQLDNDTIGLPNVLFSHDMSKGFPLLTTKKMPIRTIAVELEGFIRGITDKRWYQERKCKIWDEWANPQLVNDRIEDIEHFRAMPGLSSAGIDRKEIQKEETDLGPIYGYQWRAFDQHYESAENINDAEGRFDEVPNGVWSGTDQLQSVADKLRSNPYDRRMVVSAWNPNQMPLMALPPCHFAWNVCVYGDTLNLFWAQRSCDLMLGVPFNIASYALLLTLLARHANLKPGNLSGMLVDCHIYRNQIEGAKEQIKRHPKVLPALSVDDNAEGEFPFDIFEWDHFNLNLINYNHHDKIDFGAVTV